MMMIDQSFYAVIGTLLTIFALIITTSSLLVIVTIVRYWRSECRSTANLLTCNSSAALLFYGITVFIQIPFIFLYNNTVDSDEMNTVFCKIRSLIMTHATLTKAYSYLTMAISCFFVTILYKYRILLSFRVHWLVIVANWLLSGIIAFGTFISPSAHAYEVESGLCFLTMKHFATSFTVVTLVFIITLGTIIILYGIIIRHTIQHSRINANSESTLRAKRNIKVFRKIFLFVGILLTGGTPYFLCTILHQIGQAPWSLYAIAHLFIALSAALESMVLLFTNKQVRKILFAKFNRQQVRPVDATMVINTRMGSKGALCQNKIQAITVLPMFH